MGERQKKQQHQESTVRRPSLLPATFAPSKHSVVVGRGREQKEHAGNMKLRAMALMYLDEYSDAESDKTMKSQLVSTIVSMIKEACPIGEGFVRRKKDGRWEKVPNSVAREKVGYTFRDLLADRYKSSSKSKVARNRAMKGDVPTSPSKKNELEENPLEWRSDPSISLKSVFDDPLSSCDPGAPDIIVSIDEKNQKNQEKNDATTCTKEIRESCEDVTPLKDKDKSPSPVSPTGSSHGQDLIEVLLARNALRPKVCRFLFRPNLLDIPRHAPTKEKELYDDCDQLLFAPIFPVSMCSDE